MKYEPVIGLEVHLQVKTKSKMFCRCRADYFAVEPNTFVCPVCLGLPGALPVPNKLAIEKTIKLALALNCDINQESKFDRKNYFYPDLPKGYQISQYDLPIGYKGYLEIDVDDDARRIRIIRTHIEEDTGKSLHTQDKTLLDFNKSGVALIEIVTEADFQTVNEVTAFAKRLKQIVRYLDISDADMEKGQMRFELNMSLKPSGTKGFPDYKVEVKNIGSISVLEKVINYEFKRQSEILDKGQNPIQETRGLKDMTGQTISQRVKENADDYRYFPEPDIPPLKFTDELISKIQEDIPELPYAKKIRYIHTYGLEPDTAETIINSRTKAQWYEEAISGVDNKETSKEIAKWFVGDVMALAKKEKTKLKDIQFKPSALKDLVQSLQVAKITGTIAKQILEEMFKSGKSPAQIIQEKDITVVSDEGEIGKIVKKVISENPKIVADCAKNPNAVKFLVGLVMKETKGKASPQIAERMLRDLILS